MKRVYSYAKRKCSLRVEEFKSIRRGRLYRCTLPFFLKPFKIKNTDDMCFYLKRRH